MNKLWGKLKQEAFEEGTIAPSLLSADFSKLGEEILSVENSGVEWLHLDIMDGHFVPNLTFGPLVVASIRKRTESFLDCHLMVSEPDRWVDEFIAAGADCITIHQESTPHLHRLIQRIKEKGVAAGVSLNPSTPVSTLSEIISEIDLVLVMSVNPGFGGQAFIPSTLRKVEQLVEMKTDHDFIIQIDGGMSSKTIAAARSAGVDVFVAGSAIFSEKDRRKAILALSQQLDIANGTDD